MAENQEPVPATEIGPETKKIINPRAEIDTSPPFASVKEAVTRFGGSGSWIPHHLLRLAAHHGIEFNLDKVEEQAAELEKDLLAKERETLCVLNELGAAKKFVEGLKVELVKEVSKCMATPELNSFGSMNPCPAPSPGLILMELNQTKLNLNKTTGDLAAIRASVESLNNTIRKQKISRENPPERQMLNTAGVLSIEEKLDRARLKLQLTNGAESQGNHRNSPISSQLQQLNFEAEQFKKIAEAARYELMKAMSEIEQTKTSINMVEMRLIAARKMEEAARAVEVVAFAEMKAQSSSKGSSGAFLPKAEAGKPEGVTLSFEEYSSLTQKAQIAEEMTKEVKHGKKSQEQALGKVEAGGRRTLIAEEAFFGGTPEHSEMRHSGGHNSMFRFKNSYPSYGHRDSQVHDGNESNPIKEKTVPVLRSTISIGDVLSRKLILQDDYVVGKHVKGHTDRQHVSLSQMLREQSGLILQPEDAVKDGIVHKQFFTQRKKFGFIDISLPLTKQRRRKTQALNLR